ncbi:TIR domain-containing protein [Micromonospora zingiberis]|uniref:TIR domain-containing protein n=1 Tax=Micromonospora zingiberis TaxID=2053011 RepID=A0A4R0GLM3_9ACTN|nr:TIR domain-containing protein [Micromonospora zingiberis]TCB97303.1 TIR domain-containing protein [Micromonospora zingiberis]
MAASGLRYAAFISYSTDADRQLARSLRGELHRFNRPWYRARALRVFLDHAGLAASPGLWSSITAVLDQSEYFILLASTEAAASSWVNREIEYWLDHKSAERLLIAITNGTDGKIVWDATTKTFHEGMTCIPPALHGRLPEQPRCIDLREVRSENFSAQDPRFKERVAELAAPLHGIAKDDLIGADIRQHRITRLLIRATVATLTVLTLLAAATTVVAINRAHFAETKRAEAEDQRNLATTRLLLQEADRARVDDPRAAARLGAVALWLRDSDAARAGLRETMNSTPIATTLHQILPVRAKFATTSPTLAVHLGGAGVALLDATNTGKPTYLNWNGTDQQEQTEAVDFAADGKLLALGNRDGSVALVDLTDRDRPRQIGRAVPHGSGVKSVAFSGSTLAIEGGGEIVLWNIADPAQPQRLASLGRQSGPVTFSPGGRTLMTATSQHSYLWDVTDPATPRQLSKFAAQTSGPLVSAGFTPQGDMLMTAGFDNLVILWDVTDLSAPRQLGPPVTDDSRFVAISPDGQTLATASDDRTVSLWDISDPMAPTRERRLTGHTGPVVSVSFSPDGLTLATTSLDQTVMLWRLSDSSLPRKVSQRPIANRAVTALAFAPGGRLLGVGTADGAVLLWETTDPGSPRAIGEPIVGHAGELNAVAFSPSGTVLASAGGPHVIIRDIADPARPQALSSRGEDGPYAGTMQALRFLPDGTKMVTILDGKLQIWDVGDPRRPRTIVERDASMQGPAHRLAIAADGRVMATASRSLNTLEFPATIWDSTDPTDPTNVSQAGGHGKWIHALDFSPDGKTLATGGDDGTVVLVDVTDPSSPRQLGQPFTHHSGSMVSSLLFTPDGNRLITASEDGTITAWDLTDMATPRRIGQQKRAHTSKVSAMAISPEGRTLATGGDDGKLTLWDIGGENEEDVDLMKQACAFAGRGLNEKEWYQYFDRAALPHRNICPQ